MSRLIQPFDPARHMEFIRDESMRSGNADTISFPCRQSQVRQVLATLFDRQVPVTVQGSRTGITGQALPGGGHILNLSAMNQITGMTLDPAGHYCLKVQPGVILADLNCQTASRRFEHAGQWDRSSLAVLDRFQNEPFPWFWPPDPTEDTASIGGMSATNARGICVHAYGRSHQHIRAVQGMDARGNIRMQAQKEELDVFLSTNSSPMVITELTLPLLPVPSQVWGVVFFFPGPGQAPGFIDRLMSGQTFSGDTGPAAMAGIAAMELMDQKTLAIINGFKTNHPSFRSMPKIVPASAGAVYLELHGNSEEVMADLATQLMDAAKKAGGDPDASLAATSHVDLSRLRLLRKAAPHAVSYLTACARQKDDRIFRLGYDMVRSDISVSEQVQMLETDMADAGVTGVVFGHAADSCLHVNLVPEDHDAYLASKAVIQEWAGREKPLQTNRTNANKE
jgi:D-lactate dehydrogenase (cytochrome)